MKDTKQVAQKAVVNFLELVAVESYRIANKRSRSRTTWRVALTAARKAVQS